MATASKTSDDAHESIARLKRRLANAMERESNAARDDPKGHIPGPAPANHEVPVHVTERTRMISPDPPPTSRPAVAKISRKSDKVWRGKKGPLKPGEDDGSDSDPDETNRKGIKDVQTITKKKRETGNDIDHSNELDDPFARGLVIEENERVKQMRDLRKIGEKLGEMEEERSKNKLERQMMTNSVGKLNQYDPTNHYAPQRLLDFDRRLREYLDDVLYGAIKDNGWESAAQILTEREEIVQWLEMSVLGRCVQFDVWKFSNKPLNERISVALKSVEQQCWRSDSFALALQSRRKYMELVPQPVSSDPSQQPPKPWTKDIEVAVRTFFERAYPEPQIFFDTEDRESQIPKEPRFVDKLEELFWAKIVEKLVNAATRATSMSSPAGDWLQLFEHSRDNGHLKASYIDWATEGANPVQFDQLCIDWQKVKREKALDRYHRSMGSIKITVEQVFCPGVVRDEEVSLLLLKGGYPTGIRTVSLNELKNLGWFRDHEKPGFNFWRCERTYQNGTGYWLKVDMNGKVLAAFCFEDDCFAYRCTGVYEYAWKRRPLTYAERLAILGY